jgi:hypothetical protein
LLGLLERYADATDRSEPTARALFFILHLAGERRETRAFAPLCRLAHDAEALDFMLGDGTTETLASILIGTYDGTLDVLKALIEAPEADAFVRSEALEALGFLTAAGDLDPVATTAYLRQLYTSLQPQAESFVWFSWALVIAIMRLEALDEVVEQAYARELIPLELGDLDEFHDMRRDALADASLLASFEREGIAPLDDAIDVLSAWSYFSGEDADDDKDFDLDAIEIEPVVNPYRDVGRNDPCPCGSGKKFKKCCLGLSPA